MTQKRMTKTTACETVAQSLREWGYQGVTTTIVRDVLDAWLEGKRDDQLPHSVIGMFAGRQFDDCEREWPGSITKLPD